MKFRIGVLLVISNVFFVCALAQQFNTAVFTGKVKSVQGDGLPGSSVIISESNQGAITDQDGNFSIRNISPGEHVVVITTIGYTTQTVTLTFAEGKTVTRNFTLEESSTQLELVEIVGKSESREIKETAFNVNAIETKPLANTTADLNQLLNRTTGVRVREQGGMGSDFNFSINGLSGKAVKFFIDGIPMEVMGSTMSLNNIPVNLAQRIEVYKGVVPVALGSDALGGAVNIITNQQVANYLDASYSFGSFNSHRAAVTGQYIHSKTGVIVKASGFYNYSDNNYIMKGMEIWDEQQYKYVRKDFRRFHDHYQSVMGQLEAGVRNKKWADVFFIGGSYSATKQDIQTGTRQDIVYGDVVRQGDAYSYSARYRKDNLFVKGLNVNAFVSRSVDQYVVTDTSAYKYYWDGSRVQTNQAELGGSKTRNKINRPKTFARLNVGYEINTNHSFNLNYTFDRIRNETYDMLIADKDEIPGLLGKHILGVAYQQNFLDKRLTNTFFGKYYGVSIEQARYVTVSGQYNKASDFLSNYGYGIASRFKISEEAGVKVSYERAYRLQEVGEMFGNGYTIIGNLDLKPENSHNFNTGAYLGKQFGPHRLFTEAAVFFRDASDFIYAVVYQSNASVSRYENTSKVQVKGLEAEVRYDYSNLLNVSINASYQNAINNTKYSPGVTSGTPEATYRNKIPNQPWMFANADFSIGKNDWPGKDTRVQFNWGTQYVHWFYLSWEAYGSKSSKNQIPNQYQHQASVTYSRNKGKYNVSLECRNLTDNLAYDNFRLQKPGRSFAVKMRYFIR